MGGNSTSEASLSAGAKPTGNAPFAAVLIANRGEIALRIARTVRSQGARVIAVHHREDAAAPFARFADEAVEITGPSPVAAYLDIDQIVAAARATGAAAVHPGYGFLAENAEFARAVEAAGMAFIGPQPDVIALMGDKVRARAFVAERGFPVLPSAIEDDDPATFVERARAVGAPLLIKPAAGGGGKGMRIVRDLDTLEAEIERGRSEGQRYFGDGRLYVERYVERPRHIEVQVLGDGQGGVVHFFERECSIQRRFQKLIEETPSPALDDAGRQSICEAAAGIARAVGYRNAGTIEFIYGQDGGFYFLEMNTRLQVEHPVTEMITGYDLVAEQLRVAAGEALGYGQDAIGSRGHAIEFRLCAEDAARDFAPAIGDILLLRMPEGEGVRVDSGIAQGGAVSPAFDPMLAKIIVHGQDRAEAITRGIRALKETVLLGVTTNAGFLRRIVEQPGFRAGETHTGFIAEHLDALIPPPPTPDQETLLVAAAALANPQITGAAEAVPDLHAAMGGWRKR
jgi:propionyl-CoA carboxylase alpha chain/3-methylcrotonyl-CoA carboxylase alpha subunit/acetyl-CoA/propionyl-CoA carboxylase biotin carboxyl carrier protein